MGSSILRRCFAVVLGIVLAELALRAGAPLFGESPWAGQWAAERDRLLASVREVSGADGEVSSDPAESETEAGEGADVLSRIVHDGRFLHPYVGWGTQRALSVATAEAAREGEAESFDVWIVGGSVAAMFGDRKMGAIEILGERLAESDALEGREPRFVNLASGSYKQPQQVELVAYLLTWLEPPDLLINLDGFNEVALGTQNLGSDSHPLYPSVSAWNPIAASRTGTPEELEASGELFAARDRLRRAGESITRLGLGRLAITGLPSLTRLRKFEREFRASQGHYERTLAARTDDALRGPIRPSANEVQAVCVQGWERSSLALGGLLSAFDVPYLHVLQPTLHDPGAKPIAEAERKRGKIGRAWRTGVEIGYPLLREAGQRLAQRGVAFVDATGVFAQIADPLYLDNCHFGVRGNRLLAEAVAPALVELVERP